MSAGSDNQTRHVPGVFELIPPRTEPVPVVFDSPHSGRKYPDDFGHCMSWEGLRRLEDAYVDELFLDAPKFGVTLLRALFPRSYIDPNRAPDDLDRDLLEDDWPHELNPGPKSECGIGLIFRLAAEGPVYDRKLAAHEVRRRLDRYYWPYHEILQNTLDGVWRRFGSVFHVNCHSMRSVSPGAYRERKAARRPDFVLGDRDGTSCAPALTARVREYLGDAGFEVSVNAPYKGFELVRRYSDPAQGRNSLQIEINRALYLDEARIERNEGFNRLQEALRDLTRAIADFVRER